VYLQVNTLSASGAVHATDLNLGLGVGGFGVQVAHGTLDFTPTASLAVKKPDGTKKLTLADLQSTSIGDLVSLRASNRTRLAKRLHRS